jgi:hypothetical protein
MTKFLRKSQLAARYGITPRSVDRWSHEGRLPQAKYLRGSRLPLWDLDEIEALERRAIERPRPASAA